MRLALVECLDRALADPAVSVIVILGEGRSFPAGADIAEFGKPPVDPGLPEVCNRIEAASKPVVAALHGNALGGGFELALAAHYRVALNTTRLGLPEVTLGILPGAGGTQRAPRLAGAELSLNMMLSGKPKRADSDEVSVFVDRLIDGNLREGAVRFAKELVERGAGPHRTCESSNGFADPMAYQRAIAEHRKTIWNRPETAPKEIVSCVEAAALLSFEQGTAFERAAFETCVQSDQSAALRHAFFAERRAARFPELKSGKPSEIRSVGIVGGGAVGCSIAMASLSAGFDVTVVERDSRALEAALNQIDAILERAVKRGLISANRRDRLRTQLVGATDFTAVSKVDLVIEAVSDDAAAKKSVFAQLGGVVREGAILAASSPRSEVTELARQAGVSGEVLGLFFRFPAHATRLVEIAVTADTAADTAVSTLAYVKKLGKVPVRTRSGDTIGNRMMIAYRLAADMMLEDGATPYLIDTAMEDFGMASGPYKTLDMEGLQADWERRKRQASSGDSNMRAVAIADRLCEACRFGRRSGKGYYLYEDASKQARPDPEVIALIRAERERNGLTARGFKPEEIQRRCLLAMVNQGARLLREGIAMRPSDIDTVMLHGYGFPRWRGGPMMAADLTGLLHLKNDLEIYTREDPEFWKPDPIFDELIKNGQGFSNLNS